jgi:hypothetical protein
MVEVLKKFLVVLAFLGALSLVGWAFVTGLDEQEVMQCNILLEQSVEFKPLFFLSKSEDEMCRAHGIPIDAPVGNKYDSN